jgi:hypothetical protein
VVVAIASVPAPARAALLEIGFCGGDSLFTDDGLGAPGAIKRL